MEIEPPEGTRPWETSLSRCSTPRRSKRAPQQSLEAEASNPSLSLAELVQRPGAEKKSRDKKLTAKEAAQDVFERFNRPRGEAPSPERRRPPEQPAKVLEVEPMPEKAAAVSRPVSRGVSQRHEFSLSATMLAKLTVDTEFTGVLLRELRESVQLELEDLERITKVSKRYLRALESEDFENLPASVYVRGFISHYAKVLGLDSNRVSKSYMAVLERVRSRSKK